jgi:hypothetical protein
MLLSVQRRAVRGMTVSANYTWSHCIGDFTDANGMGPSPEQTYRVPDNRNADRGNCDADRRQLLNLTGVAETPRFTNPIARTLATGWRLSGIYRLSSGEYLTVLSGLDRALNGVAAQRPNQVKESPYGDTSGRPRTSYFAQSAFSQTDLGTNGNVGRNSVAGPRSWQLDMSLSRVFTFRESNRLEFRAEAYNLTNSFRSAAPNMTLNSAQFGQILTSREPRIMQFALKYVF